MKKVFLCISVALMLALSSIVARGQSTTYSTSTATLQSVALQFLEQVTGFNTSNYQVTVSTPSGPQKMLNTQITPHFEDFIKANVSSSRGESEAFLDFVDGNFWLYQLDSSSWDNLGINEQSFNDSLNTLIKVANGYYALFNASYCSDFARLASTALQTQELSVENRDFSLQIQNGSAAAPLAMYATCYNKIDGQYIVPFRSMQVGISKTGLVTELADNMIYHVATTNVTVSEDQALTIAEPYVQAFAQQNQQHVKAINATFNYARDGNENRGDSFAIYPQWAIQAWYDKPGGEYYAYAYWVVIWADNGAIALNAPEYGYPPKTNVLWSLQLLLIAALIIILVLALGMYLHRTRKKKPEANHETRT